MKRLLPVVSLLLLPAGGLRAADWKLAWSDEFNYQGLPAPAKWDYEEGFVRNHESQYYTRARLENARVENGHLILECRKEHYQPKNHVPHGLNRFIHVLESAVNPHRDVQEPNHYRKPMVAEKRKTNA